MKIFYSLLINAFILTTPVVTHAAPTDFKSLVALFVNLIELLIALIFALTFVVFMWGIVKEWIIGGSDEEGVKNGKNLVIAGVIAFVVMSSIWGIVYFFQSSLFGGSSLY
jgi:hypothetical protein